MGGGGQDRTLAVNSGDAEGRLRGRAAPADRGGTAALLGGFMLRGYPCSYRWTQLPKVLSPNGPHSGTCQEAAAPATSADLPAGIYSQQIRFSRFARTFSLPGTQ